MNAFAGGRSLRAPPIAHGRKLAHTQLTAPPARRRECERPRGAGRVVFPSARHGRRRIAVFPGGRCAPDVADVAACGLKWEPAFEGGRNLPQGTGTCRQPSALSWRQSVLGCACSLSFPPCAVGGGLRIRGSPSFFAEVFRLMCCSPRPFVSLHTSALTWRPVGRLRVRSGTLRGRARPRALISWGTSWCNRWAAAAAQSERTRLQYKS